MELVWFGAFLVLSHFGVMLVFTLTTYHRYFWPALPILLAYSALIGWGLFALELHAFFFWQLLLAGAWLFVVGRKQSKSAEAMLTFAGDDAAAVRSVARSVARTKTYYTASSVVYLAGFSVTYLALFNRYAVG